MRKSLLGPATVRSAAFAIAFASFAPAAATAQQSAVAPAARAADVATIDAIMAAVYDVISGPKGEKRDWARFESLFAPGARLIPTGRTPEGASRARVLTPAEYAQSSGPYLEAEGFFESEVFRVTEQYGRIAHVFSTYESRRTLQDAAPFMRGINSFQLMNDGSRWWVLSIFWEAERPDNPIPARYLPGGGPTR